MGRTEVKIWRAVCSTMQESRTDLESTHAKQVQYHTGINGRTHSEHTKQVGLAYRNTGPNATQHQDASGSTIQE